MPTFMHTPEAHHWIRENGGGCREGKSKIGEAASAVNLALKFAGIGLLEKLLRSSAKNEIPFKERAEELAKIQALLTEINGTRAQIERLQSQMDFLFPDEHKVRACNLLKTKLENLLSELEQIAELKRAI